MAENDAKLGSQNDPKSVQNRYRKLIKILIDFWIDLGASWGDLGAILGAPEAELRNSGAGSAVEAWALPRYLPSVIPLDFEEIVKIIFFE